MSQLSLSKSGLSFNKVKFSVIDKDNQVWLRGSQISKALGYSTTDAITKIYTRNKDEFTENMTQVIEIFETVKLTASTKTKELRRKIRIFSLRGCHLLAMLANTPVAKDFRKWVLDILENQVPHLPAKTAKPELTFLPVPQKLPTLMFDYEPNDFAAFHARQMLERYGYKPYAYNAYMLSCKACELFNDFEQKIKELMKDYDKISKPVYSAMYAKVTDNDSEVLQDGSHLNTKEELDRHNECVNFTSTMWQTLGKTYSKFMYSRSDYLRNEVDQMIQTLRHTAKVLDM